MNAVDYAKLLISKHGITEAKRIASNTLNLSKTGTITLYTDVEWTMGTKGLEMSKTNRKEGTKDKRESSLVKFWTAVLNNIK